MPLSIQPSYPVVLPIWTSDCDDPLLVQLVEELNIYDEASSDSSHPVSSTCKQGNGTFIICMYSLSVAF